MDIRTLAKISIFLQVSLVTLAKDLSALNHNTAEVEGLNAQDPTDEYPDKKKLSGFTSWGKRDNGNVPDGDAENGWKELSVRGKRDDEMDKKWKEMSVRGKRDGEMDKKWKEMSVRGKRDGEMDKKWKEMYVRGKRDGEMDKNRKQMSMWEKRGDNLDNKLKEMFVLGKRDDAMDRRRRDMVVLGNRYQEVPNVRWNYIVPSSTHSYTPDLNKLLIEISVGWRRNDGQREKKWRQVGLWIERNGELLENSNTNVDTSGEWDTLNPEDYWRSEKGDTSRNRWDGVRWTHWGKRSIDIDPSLLKDDLQRTKPLLDSASEAQGENSSVLQAA